jgi:hypothetical protein
LTLVHANESPEAFKSCQQIIEDYVQSIDSEVRGLDVVIEASRNVIRHYSRVSSQRCRRLSLVAADNI